MKRRQRKKELNKYGVTLNDAAKDPIDAVQRAAAIISAVYVSDDSVRTKIVVQLEVARLMQLMNPGRYQEDC